MTKDKHQETMLPITWEGWDQIDDFGLQFYCVTFTSDFGPIRTGESFDTVYVNFDDEIMEVYKDDFDGPPTVLHTIRLRIIPA
jgi:hypothetical protein